MKVSYLAILNSKKYFSGFGIIAMIFGFSAMAEAWVTPDSGRNLSEILPHSTPFLNGQSESLDLPSAIFRGAPPSTGKGIQKGKKICIIHN